MRIGMVPNSSQASRPSDDERASARPTSALDQSNPRPGGWIEPGGLDASQHEGEGHLASLLRRGREESVGPGPAKIDRRYRFSEACRPLDEAEAGIDHQRGADDQHGVGFIQ